MAFPSNLTNAQPGDTIQSAHLNNLEAKVGIDNSEEVTSLDYGLKNSASVSPGHQHGVSDIANLQDVLDLKANIIDPIPTTGTYSGTVINGTNTSGGTLNFGDLCYMGADGFKLADADATTTMPAVAMAVATIANDASGVFLLCGFARSDAWSELTIGALAGSIWVTVTATTGNTWSQTAPASGKQGQVVGFATPDTYTDTHAGKSKTMFFNPTYTIFEVA